MARDPQVDLIFSHFTPRYVATGVDPNDLNALMSRISHWGDWHHSGMWQVHLKKKTSSTDCECRKPNLCQPPRNTSLETEPGLIEPTSACQRLT